ncbi:MAG: type II secretion system F family protein [Cyanobacteriota bacterium]|jgi:type IV pilus assembly protein PilC|nr:type II secretion system F family protein [Cyanobacteriota bacterium]
MPKFIASYTNSRGKTAVINIEAPDAVQARRKLRQRGIGVIEIKSQNQSSTSDKAGEELSKKLKLSKLSSLFEAKPGIKQKAVFASKMSALVSAGVPIVRSIDLMAAQQKLPLFKRALQSISLDVNQGVGLGMALRRWPQVFDRLTIAMVEAGEAGGVLDESLRRLAKLLEDNAKLQNQIKGAMGYPVAVFVIAIAVFLGMTIFIIPTFAGIFDDLGAELPWFTQMMVDLSGLLRSPFSLILIAGLSLFIYLFVRYYKTPVGRRQVDGIILKIPVFGDLIQKTTTAQFCRTFSSLTRAGVPILLSLEIVKEITSNAIMSDAISKSREDVTQGVPLSIALGRLNVFPELAISMLSIGEETGEMDAMLSKVADFYEDEVESAVKALTSMLEPAMIVLVGGIVASILVAMYLPMFSVFENIR